MLNFSPFLYFVPNILSVIAACFNKNQSWISFHGFEKELRIFWWIKERPETRFSMPQVTINHGPLSPAAQAQNNKKKKTTWWLLFYWHGSSTSRLWSYYKKNIFISTNKSPENLVLILSALEGSKVENHGTIKWFWTQELWIGNLTLCLKTSVT